LSARSDQVGERSKSGNRLGETLLFQRFEILLDGERRFLQALTLLLGRRTDEVRSEIELIKIAETENRQVRRVQSLDSRSEVVTPSGCCNFCCKHSTRQGAGKQQPPNFQR
jgi:hypothetical protein